MIMMLIFFINFQITILKKIELRRYLARKIINKSIFFLHICENRLFQTPQIASPEKYQGFWITGEINADGHMEIKVARL